MATIKSIEEKAKAYDEAIKALRSLFAEQAIKHCDRVYIKDITNIFSELKIEESEDEKIRQLLLRFVKYDMSDNYSDDFTPADCVAWLEKQGEKLAESNWCHHKVDLSNCSDEYCKAYYDGWNNCNMQHSQCRSELDDVVKCLINGMKFYYEEDKEATWGTTKWSMPIKHIIEVLEKQGEQKSVVPKFKIGDTIVRKDCHNKATTHTIIGINNEDKTYVFRNINDKYGSDERDFYELERNYELDEQNPAWSEEDEEALEVAIIALEDMYSEDSPLDCYAGHHMTFDKAANQLKSLKDRVQQQKQEWSEEDEKRMNHIIQFFEDKDRWKDSERAFPIEEDIRWLKALKPQNTWKPSGEMLEALYRVIPENAMDKSEDEILLDKLYQGLKYGRVLIKN